MKNTSNIIKIVKELTTSGYTEEFKVMENQLYWVKKAEKYTAESFDVDFAYRLESADTVEDTSLVYGISVRGSGIKGVLIDAFDTLSSISPNSIIDKILTAETTLLTHEDSDAQLKFGILPKVHKSKFNEDPHRYILRKGFPDFPACPFGQSFTMLGFDTKLKVYVWLTTEIIKDQRLAVIDFKEGKI